MADDFGIRRSDIFFIMGGSGCGKSTLLRHPIGLNEPARGHNLVRRHQSQGRLGRGNGTRSGAASAFCSRARALELHDARRERRSSSRAVHAPRAGGDRRGGHPEARARGASGLRGLLPVRRSTPRCSSSASRPPVSIRSARVCSTSSSIAHDGVFQDRRTMSARGNPRELLANPPNPNVHRFLTRGRSDGGSGSPS